MLSSVRGQSSLQNGDLLPHGDDRHGRRLPLQRRPRLARFFYIDRVGATRGGIVAGGRLHPLLVAGRPIHQHLQAHTKSVTIQERGEAYADNGRGVQCG